MGRVWALGRWTGTRTAQSPGWWMHGRTGVARVCGGWSRRGIGWKWKWTRGSPGWPFRSTGRTCRSSLRTTHANVRRRWHARALLVACQLGFYGHPYTASGGAVVMRTHCDVRPGFLPVFCTCIDCTIFYWMYWGCIYDSRVEMDMYVFLLEL